MFASTQPQYKQQTLKLAKMMNQELLASVNYCQNKYGNRSLKIIFSDILSKLSTDSLDCVTDIDGWHPSAKGQRHLAQAAWPIIQE